MREEKKSIKRKSWCVFLGVILIMTTTASISTISAISLYTETLNFTETNRKTDATIIDDLSPTFKEREIPILSRGDPWTVTLYFSEMNGKTDYVIIAESSLASEGVDSFDVPKPGLPPMPYLYAWLNNSLPVPYNYLWEDYRNYSGIDKVWNLNITCNSTTPYLQWTTNITISWNLTEVSNIRFTDLELWYGGSKIVDMTSEKNYTFTANMNTYPMEYRYHFQIKGHVNQAPTAEFSYEPLTPSTADTVVFTDLSTDDEGSVVSWSWDFGDGGSATVQHPTHQYADDGIYTVTLNVTDDDGATDSVSHDVTVSNVPPTANDDTATTNEDTPLWINVLANDTDPDGTLTPSTVTVTSGPTHGTTNINTTTGSIQYTPETNYYGSDSFTYTINDDDGAPSNTATVNITINDVNDPPTANDDTATTNEDTPLWINVLANDTDPDGTLNPSTVTVTSGPTHGTTNINTTTGSIQYTPETNYYGSDSFIYTVNDDDGAPSNTATVTITVLEKHQISLKTGWNLISIPCYDSITKAELTVYYNGASHSWSQAVADGYLMNYIYNYNRATQTYGFSDSLEPGYGYWIWAYNICDLLMYSNEEGTGHITNLQDGWNIMGLPYRTPIVKTATYIQNASGTYTWNNAVTNHIILGFIYGWDSLNQMYDLCDTFDPTRGYWMYSYQDCTMLK
ncbi:MAG: hypothetical protein BV458_02565 [Thermoplasmata archaeon M9B2D]|nr:MAG: hypothetical protein BV458_02565 [Thermoplasmata archaeon M9B2D]